MAYAIGITRATLATPMLRTSSAPVFSLSRLRPSRARHPSGSSTPISRPLSSERFSSCHAIRPYGICYEHCKSNASYSDAANLNRARFLVQPAATQSRQTPIGIKQTAIPPAAALVATATPEKRWCQAVSKGGSHKSVAARLGANPWRVLGPLAAHRLRCLEWCACVRCWRIKRQLSILMPSRTRERTDLSLRSTDCTYLPIARVVCRLVCKE
jgi:hypothetical protein